MALTIKNNRFPEEEPEKDDEVKYHGSTFLLLTFATVTGQLWALRPNFVSFLIATPTSVCYMATAKLVEDRKKTYAWRKLTVVMIHCSFHENILRKLMGNFEGVWFPIESTRK